MHAAVSSPFRFRHGDCLLEGCCPVSNTRRFLLAFCCRHGDPGLAPPAAILLRSLRKVFPSRDGNAEKVGCAGGPPLPLSPVKVGRLMRTRCA